MTHPLIYVPRRRLAPPEELWTPAACANAFGHGHGHGHGLGGRRKVWTPADWGADRLVDYTADDVLTSGAAVTAWVDQRGTANATQANAALQGVLHTSPNRVYVNDDYYQTASIATASASFATLAVFNAANTASIYQRWVWLGAEPSVFAVAHTTVTGESGFYNGSANRTYGAGTSAAGLQSIANAQIVTGSQLWRGGGLVGTNTVAIPATSGISYFCGGTASPYRMLDTYMYRMTVLNRELAAADRTNWFAWTNKEYGV